MARIQSEEPRAIEYQQRLMRSMKMKPLLISLAIIRFLSFSVNEFYDLGSSMNNSSRIGKYSEIFWTRLNKYHFGT